MPCRKEGGKHSTSSEGLVQDILETQHRVSRDSVQFDSTSTAMRKHIALWSWSKPSLARPQANPAAASRAYIKYGNGRLGLLVGCTVSGFGCDTRDKTGLLQITFQVSVSPGECPNPSETVPIPEGVNGGLPCKQTEIFELNVKKEIQWMRDCQPVQAINVDHKGFLRLSAVSERDSGKYTCLVNISVGGRKYTAARSMQLAITDDTVAIEAHVVSPINEVIVVQVGMPVEVKCLVLIGVSEDPEIIIHWTFDGTFAEDLEGITVSLKYFHDRGRVYGLSTLSISKVLHQFLEIPISCNVESPLGKKTGSVWLQEAQQISVAVCVSAFLALVVLCVAFLFFKVDLVLAYRKLLIHFSKHQAHDGKLYDGFVSFLHPNNLTSAETASFALQVLSEELERKHGYSLYIRGRDDCPGEAVHDAIAATVHQCRRLIIIILSSEEKHTTANDKADKVSPMYENQIQLCYEQRVGLHDALTHDDPRVILLEIDDDLILSPPSSTWYAIRREKALRARVVSAAAFYDFSVRLDWK
ncbi:hypothetical protein Q8A73_009707 [Channa argus]|nr:hypothetical protein Q8A73_009707 [Channa argus]